MHVVRINRMMLGVATRVAELIGRAAGEVKDVEFVFEIDPAADVLVIGRQRLREDGVTVFGYDILDQVAERCPPRVVYVLPDRFDERRYARDLDSWRRAAKRGTRVVVIGVAQLREVGNERAEALLRARLASTGGGIFNALDDNDATATLA